MCVYGPPGPGFENTDLNKTILDMSSGLILPKRNEWLYFFLDHLRQKEGCLCVCVVWMKPELWRTGTAWTAWHFELVITLHFVLFNILSCALLFCPLCPIWRSLTSDIEISWSGVSCPGAVRRHTLVFSLIWFLAILYLQCTWKQHSRSHNHRHIAIKQNHSQF